MKQRDVDAVGQELHRILGKELAATQGLQFVLLLPFASEKEVLSFFQTVPSGTSPDQLRDLAEQYRRLHPVRSPSE